MLEIRPPDVGFVGPASVGFRGCFCAVIPDGISSVWLKGMPFLSLNQTVVKNTQGKKECDHSEDLLEAPQMKRGPPK